MLINDGTLQSNRSIYPKCIVHNHNKEFPLYHLCNYHIGQRNHHSKNGRTLLFKIVTEFSIAMMENPKLYALVGSEDQMGGWLLTVYILSFPLPSKVYIFHRKLKNYQNFISTSYRGTTDCI